MRTLLTILLLAALASAQAWGPAGVPLDWRGLGLTWMESSKFTTAGATSYLSMDGDTLTFTLDGTSGTRNPYLRFRDEDGNYLGDIFFDASQGRFKIATNSSLALYMNGQLSITGDIQFGAPSSMIDWDNIAGGVGYLGGNSATKADTTRIRVNDVLRVDGYADFNGQTDIQSALIASMFGSVKYIDADYSALATDWQIIATDTCRVTLPALSVAYDSLTAATGYGLQLDIFAATAACTISTVADSIYGNVEVVLTPGDNGSFRAGEDWWILR